MRYFTHSFVQFIIVFCSLTLSVTAFAASTQNAEETSQAPNGKLPDTVTPLSYDIALTIVPNEEVFSGVATIAMTLNEATDHLWLHGQDLSVSNSSLKSASGKIYQATYQQVLETGVAKVSLPQTITPGDYELKITYEASVQDVPQGFFRASYKGEHYWMTQFQTTHARRVFPSFDEPRFKQPFQFTITTPKDVVAIANSPMTDKQSVSDTHLRYTFAQTEPLPTYLVAFAVGPYEINDFGMLPKHEYRDRPLRFRGLTAQGKSNQMTYGLANTPQILNALEAYFDAPYPYAKLDFIAPPMPLGFAMENPGAVLFDQYFMLLDKNSSARQKYTHYALNAHELAHMWFGNLVTPKWWDDLWLNESFATWLAVKINSDVWPEGGFQLANLSNGLYAMEQDSISSVRRVRQPIVRNEEIAYAIDGSITYFKGAALLRMLEQHVSEDGFRDGIRHHMQRFAHTTATTEDFITSLAQSNDMEELTPMLMSFISQPGVPMLDVELLCDTTPVTAKVQQSRYVPLGSKNRSADSAAQVWTLPVCLTTNNTRYCQVIDTPTATLELSDSTCPAYVHANPHGAYYRFNMSSDAWRKLIAKAPELSPEAVLTMVDSLDAALRSGNIDSATWLAGIKAAAQHSNPDVVGLAATRFVTTTEALATANGRALAAQYNQTVFQPVFQELEEASPDIPTQRLKDTLYEQFVNFAKDAKLRGPLVRKGIKFVESGGDLAAAGLAADETELALTVAVEELDRDFYQQLLALAVRLEKPTLVSSSLIALAATEDEELTRELLTHVRDEAFGLFDTLDLFAVLFANANTRTVSFEWLQEHVDSIFARMPSEWRGYWLPSLGEHFCSTEKAQAWHDFVTSHGAKLGSYERELSNTIEKIETCAALRSHISDEMVNALAR